MGYVFQPARVELSAQIARHKDAVRGRVLDVGAGSFARYRDLFSFDEYVTLDVKAGAGVDVVGSADSLPFPDASFDTVFSTQVFGDVYDLKKAFAECFRVLRPDGALLLTEALFDSLHDEPHDYWRFTESSLRKLAEDAGFVVEAVERRGGFWSVRAQMMLRYLIERFDIYHAWYRRPFNVWARAYGSCMMWLDRHDHSGANRIFTHGYLLVARKPR